MENQRKRKLYIVRESEGRQAEEPKKEKEAIPQELQEQTQEDEGGKRWTSRKLFLAAAAVVVLAAAIFLVIHLQTYGHVRVDESYKITGASDSSYVEFADGVLKYSRDGVVCLNQKGEERWNQPCQFKSPFVEINGTTAAVADKGGNDIMVFQEDGLKGEIHTTLPIEKIAVSGQGIVSAILKNESAPEIICYDTAGNVLVEHKTSFAGTGYPMDVALSEDGELMMVVYLSLDGAVSSKTVYYNFGKAGEDSSNYEVAQKVYEDSVLTSGFFLNRSVSVAAGDNCLTFFKGKDKPKEVTTVTLEKEVKSLFHNEKYVGLVLKNKGKGGYELRLYNASGKQVMSKDFSGDYKNVKLCGSQVILYDGKKCSIFMRNGVQKFEGEMDNDILEIFPVSGVNKYIVMNANGMENIRLVK